MADIAARNTAVVAEGRRSGLHRLMQRKSTIAFLMALPLILLIAILVAYPAGYAVYLAMLNKSMTKFVGLRQLRVPVQAPDLLGDRLPVLPVRDQRGDLQGANRFCRGALRSQHSTKGQRKWRGNAPGCRG